MIGQDISQHSQTLEAFNGGSLSDSRGALETQCIPQVSARFGEQYLFRQLELVKDVMNESQRQVQEQGVLLHGVFLSCSACIKCEQPAYIHDEMLTESRGHKGVIKRHVAYFEIFYEESFSQILYSTITPQQLTYRMKALHMKLQKSQKSTTYSSRK